MGVSAEVKVFHVAEAKPEQLAGLSLLVVGSPTQKFTATGSTSSFLKSIPANGLQGVK
jgi:hypothetical protein